MRDESSPIEALIQALARVAPRRILVVGDLFLDIYTSGCVHRISPEAPVPVLSAARDFSKAGGAGNVALNLVAMGNRVSVLGRIGDDAPGRVVLDKLTGIDVGGVFADRSVATATKHRILADNQQLLRIDSEALEPIPEPLQTRFLTYVRSILPDLDAIAISDYGKGVCSRALLAPLIELARASDCPVIVDPKGRDFTLYRGATILKPNAKELHPVGQLAPQADLGAAARRVFAECPDLSWVLLTKSSEGMTLFGRDGHAVNLPVIAQEVVDVTGAGDTALAALTTGWANSMSPVMSARFANSAAGLAVRHVGCAHIDLQEMRGALLSQINFEGANSPAAEVISLSASELELAQLPRIIDRIQSLAAGVRWGSVALYCADAEVDEALLRALESLKEVQIVLRDEEQLQRYLNRVESDPRKVIAAANC